MANKHKKKHKNRGATFIGLFTRVEKTKHERIRDAEKKHKKTPE